MPFSPQFVLIMMTAAGLWFGGKYAVQGVKKVDHKICHVVTLGHKCKPEVVTEKHTPKTAIPTPLTDK